MAHNIGRLGLSSPPVYMPDEAPPAPVRLAKVLGGHRQAKLSWLAHPRGMADHYLIYRTESKEKAADVRLMGDPVAEVIAQPLVTLGGTIDFEGSADVERVEAVYEAGGFQPALDALSGQPTPNLLPGPAGTTNHRLANIALADGVEVVAVYRDSKQSLQITPYRNALRQWTDAGLNGGDLFYYRIVAARRGDGPSGEVLILSQPCSVAMVRIVDAGPPEPPEWTDASWVLLRISDNGEEAWPVNGIVPAGRRAAIRLGWSGDTSGAVYNIARRVRSHQIWQPIASQGDYQRTPAGEYRFYDTGVIAPANYSYRIRVIAATGTHSRQFRELDVPRP